MKKQLNVILLLGLCCFLASGCSDDYGGQTKTCENDKTCDVYNGSVTMTCPNALICHSHGGGDVTMNCKNAFQCINDGGGNVTMNCPVADACSSSNGSLSAECCNTSNTNQSDKCKSWIANIIKTYDEDQQKAAQAAQLTSLQQHLAIEKDNLKKIKLNLQILDLKNKIDPNSMFTNSTATALNTIKTLIPTPVTGNLYSFSLLVDQALQSISLITQEFGHRGKGPQYWRLLPQQMQQLKMQLQQLQQMQIPELSNKPLR